MSIQTSSSDLGGYILNNEFVEEDLDDNMSLTSDGVRQRFFFIVLRETFRKQKKLENQKNSRKLQKQKKTSRKLKKTKKKQKKQFSRGLGG